MIKHGKTFTHEYVSWNSMKDRCYNKNHIAYHNYGGRGIAVCDRWFNSFENFLEDMGERPKPNYSLHRIDNDGNYCPENCRWATAKEQKAHTRSSHMVTFNNKTQCLSAWADELGMARTTLDMRINKYKWSIERALTRKVRQGNYRR